jgi:hypothetical protein
VGCDQIAVLSDVAVDRNIIRWVRKNEFRLGAFQHAVVGGLVPGIPAEQMVQQSEATVSFSVFGEVLIFQDLLLKILECDFHNCPKKKYFQDS